MSTEATGEPPAPRKTGLLRVLDLVERGGNRLPDPLVLFAAMAALVVLGSFLAAKRGVSVIHPGTGASVAAVNLLSADGVRRMLAEAVKNFTSFPPLGTVLVTMLGVGIAERSGLFSVALRRLVTVVPRWAVTATLIFAGVNASLAADAGLVVLPPLGALLFVSMRRHPLAGLAAAFAGVSGGFSANLLITALDPLLAGLTETAARTVDPTYSVAPTANYYFMIVSTFLLTAVGTLVNRKWVEPRLGEWKPATEEQRAAAELPEITPTERGGLFAAGISFVAVWALVGALTLPEGALLRDAAGTIKPFYDGLVPLLMISFLVPGLVYGYFTKSIPDSKVFAHMTNETMATMGSYVALAFIASQFVAYFNWSNMGLIFAVKGANGLRRAHLSGIPLLLGFLVVAASINLFIASASAKWAVMASVFVPMLMLMGYSPETVQGTYRVGDSITNVITPLLPYYPLIIAYAKKYDPKCGVGTLISATLPYSIGFGIGWSILLVVWILLKLPLGPGAPIHYTPGQGQAGAAAAAATAAP